jgi:hypothetical protein
MPKKNKFIQFLQMAIGLTRFFILVTFYLDWGIKLVKHQQASRFGALFNQQLQQIPVEKFSTFQLNGNHQYLMD